MIKYSFFVGIDVSKAVIDVSYWQNGQAIYLGQYKNSKRGFQSMREALECLTATSSDLWFVCFENTGSYSKALLYWLIDQSIPCLEENPLRIKMSLGLRRGKDDKTDSKDICQYVFEKRDTIKPTVLDKPMIIKLKAVLSRRDLYVKQRTGLKLTHQHANMDASLHEQLSSINEEAIKQCDKQIKALEKILQDLIQSDPEAEKNDQLLQSIIGIALVTSAYLIATTNNFKSITEANKYACYCGIAPFPNSSGIKRGRSKVNHMANKKVKSILSNCILSAIKHDPGIALYYARKLEEGKSYGVISNAIKNKLIHRAFAVIKRQTPYVKLMAYA